MLWLFLAKLIIVAGLAFLAGLLIKIVFLTLREVVARVKQKLSVKAGRKVFIGAVSKLANEVRKEAERNNNVKKIDDLLDELDGEGVVTATMESDGTVDEDSIEILKAETIDDKLRSTMAVNNGEMILES